jgi:hypothetical protein
MSDPLVRLAATDLQALLRARLGHDAVSVRPHGKNLIVDVRDASGPEPVARLVATGNGRWQPGFRNHRGIWEPLPDGGDMAQAVDVLVDTLGPYLSPM